jgi:AcrR family transcriptional regulator
VPQNTRRKRAKASDRISARATTKAEAAPRARHSGNRYGRSEEARQAVLEAADDLLAEIGFAAVTIEGIAARAGVGKQTIYRWWRSKTDVLMDAFLEDAIEHLIPQDSGDLDHDLRAHLRNLAEFLTQSDAGAVFRALAGQAQHDPEMAERFRRDYLGQQREIDRVPLQRAIERGELAADTDIELAVDELVGPIYYRVLVTGEAVDSKFRDSLVTAFLNRKKAGPVATAGRSANQSPRPAKAKRRY